MYKICRIFIFMMVILLPSHGMAEELVLYAGKVYPFTIVDQDGLVSGAAVDVVAEIMKAVGNPVDASKIRAISWARAVEETETHAGTAIFCMARTPQREHKFKWVGPIAELNLGLVGKKLPRKVVKDPADLGKYKIGAVRNSGPVQIFENKYGLSADELTLLKNDALQFKMLDEGRVDLITQADTAVPNWLKKLGMKQSEFEMVHIMKHLYLYIAFNHQADDAFIAKLQTALDELKEQGGDGKSRYDIILAKYLTEGPIALQKP